MWLRVSAENSALKPRDTVRHVSHCDKIVYTLMHNKQSVTIYLYMVYLIMLVAQNMQGVIKVLQVKGG
jgi:hypothetical protein